MPVKKIKAEAQRITIVRVDVSTEVGNVGADVKERDFHSPVKGSHPGSPSFARRSPKSRDHRAASTRSPIGCKARPGRLLGQSKLTTSYSIGDWSLGLFCPSRALQYFRNSTKPLTMTPACSDPVNTPDRRPAAHRGEPQPCSPSPRSHSPFHRYTITRLSTVEYTAPHIRC